jgi:hypothetical protein
MTRQWACPNCQTIVESTDKYPPGHPDSEVDATGCEQCECDEIDPDDWEDPWRADS